MFGNLPREPEAQRKALVGGLASKLAEIVAKARPEIVYHPWNGEINGDHWAVAKAVDLLRMAKDRVKWAEYVRIAKIEPQ